MVTSAYNPIIERYRGEMPLAFVLSIIKHESDFNPLSDMKPSAPSAAKGLMQVVGSARKEYNERNGTAYTTQDLFDPETNIKIGCWIILFNLRILKSLGIKPNWTSQDFVTILALTWNAGIGSVARGIKGLRAEGDSITPDGLWAFAKANSIPYLENKAKLLYCRSVAADFFAYAGYLKERGNPVS